MKYYYVFWIPVQKKGQLTLVNDPGKRDLLDVKEYGGYLIKGDIDDNTFDITLNYREIKRKSIFPFYKKRNDEKSILFKCEDKSNRFGFVVYSVEIPEIGDGFTMSFTKDRVNPCIYHYIKEYFHIHQSHPHTHDSLLQAYASEQPVDMSLAKVRKEIYQYYIKQYDEKAEGFVTDTKVNFLLRQALKILQEPKVMRVILMQIEVQSIILLIRSV